MSRQVRDVVVDAPIVAPDTPGEQVYDLFSEDPGLLVLPVVDGMVPAGLVARDRFFIKMADRHGRALFGRRPVSVLMQTDPLLVETSTPIDELSALIARNCPSKLLEGFIVTRHGQYAGVGTALELLRVMSDESVERNHKLSALAEQLGRARIEALAASKAKSEFLATMSHEIRTPLNGVLGVAQLLAASKLDDNQADLVRIINESGNILQTVLNDVLDLSKIEAGRMELKTAPFSPAKIATDALALWQARAREKGLDLRIDLTGDHGRDFIGDATRIRQILFNLLSNAIKFTDRGRIACEISFHAIGRRRSVMRAEIADTGCGIPEGDQARLFSAFTQAEAQAPHGQGGTGLGLAICKRLSELMGGTVGFRSRAGEGSTFWFEIPLRAASETAPARPAPAAGDPEPSNRNTRILVAEDNRINQAVIRGFLGLRQLEADYADNGREALEALGTQAYDLILMDMEMPVMDGLAATRAIRQLDGPAASTPIVALTAHALSDMRERCTEAGMDDFVSKPIEQAELFRVIEAQLGRSRTADRESRVA